MHIISCFCPSKMMNMKCNTCALSLLIFLALLQLCYTWERFDEKELSDPNVDYYFKLVFEWPISFCNVPGANCIPPVPNNDFTLHGLWPERNDGRPLEFCSDKIMPEATLEEFKVRLLRIWPYLRAPNDWEESKEFYIYEWNKHGTCSELEPDVYLKTALDLAERYNLHDTLRNNRPDPIVPDPVKLYPLVAIQNAVYKGVKQWPDLKCNTRPTESGEEYQLLEIHLCYQFNDRRKLIKLDCYGKRSCRGEEKAYYPNTYTTALSDVPTEDEAEL